MWYIYYSDGSVISGTEEDVPNLCFKDLLQVQCILQEHSNGDWYIESRFDFYVWDKKEGSIPRWWGYDYPGYLTYMSQPGWKKVLLGERILSDIYDPLYKRVVTDMQKLRSGGKV